jgi:hypothetical protein
MELTVKYRVRYKISQESWSSMPVVKLKYRKAGALRWERKWNEPIDMLAYKLSPAYEERGQMSVLFSLGLHARIELLQKFIDQHGTLLDYIKMIAVWEIREMYKKEKEKNHDHLVINEWLTNGWKTIEVEVEK